MRIGFTGTRDGMSQSQKEQFVLLMQTLSPTEFHHGDCAGADAEAHDIVREFFPQVKIHVYPPRLNYMRAYKQGDILYDPDDYIPRDRRIVDSTEILIGAPKVTGDETTQSGSWYTIRYARKRQKPNYVLSR